MVASFAPFGPGATQVFVLENTSAEKVPIQIEAFHREMDADGKETRAPTDELTVYPQQLALEPNDKRNIRVTWTGDHHPARELSYRLVFSQLPVELGKPEQRPAAPGAKLTFLVQYLASLYITPPGAAPRIGLESFRVLPGGKAELVLRNSGSAHRLLKGLKVWLRQAGGERIAVSGEPLKEIEPENILAESRRKFRFPLPKPVPASATAEIELP
jgi:fimbrial chaperone protein